jgi:hypothetical protein
MGTGVLSFLKQLIVAIQYSLSKSAQGNNFSPVITGIFSFKLAICFVKMSLRLYPSSFLAPPHKPKFCNSIFTASNLFFRDTSSSLRATMFGSSARYLPHRSLAFGVPSPKFDIKKFCNSLVIALTNLRSIKDGTLSITLCVTDWS